jgi:hypothetical protein
MHTRCFYLPSCWKICTTVEQIEPYFIFHVFAFMYFSLEGSGTGVWTQHLLGKHSNTWATHLALLQLFWKWGLVFCSGLSGPWPSYFRLPVITGVTDTAPCPAFFCWGGVSLTFLSGLPGTMICPISASLVSRITGVSHQHPTYFHVFLTGL